MESLTDYRHERSSLLSDSMPRHQTGSLMVALGELESLMKQYATLKLTGMRLRDEVTRIKEDFSNYLNNYRRRTWAAANGERLGDLALFDGREHRQATITRVTDVGIQVIQSDGIARIHGSDFGLKIQERLQRNDEMNLKTLRNDEEDL